MSETNLRDYFSRIQALLGENAADEVIHHCRHILLYFPKNVAVYRFLGRALVVIGRLDEAEAALRRVLSVIPDDFDAHVLLGEVYERTRRCEDAIWHLERALDQRPSDKSVIDALRVLNHRCRNITQGKIQMTAAAVARQYMRAGDTDRALETLRSALKNAPDRVDLQLLLARILWTSGRREDAAEIALEVVDALPDCLDANRILAELWLSYDRPSDAQHYVNRIESVEPYMAVEIVQGAPPDDDTFRVEELDFRRSSQSEAVATRPDWLTDLGAAAGEAESGAGDSQDEWATWSSGMLASHSAAPPAPSTPKGAAGEELDWLSAFPMRETDTSDEELPQFDASGVYTGDLESLFGSSSEPPPADLPAKSSLRAPAADSDSENFDPFAWAQESGVEFIDEPEEKQFADLFGDDDDAPLPDMQPDPLAWMNQYSASTASDEPEYNRDEDLFQRNDLGSSSVYDPFAPDASDEEDDEPAFSTESQESSLEELDWLSTPLTRSRYSDPEVEDEVEEAAPAQPEESASQAPVRGLTSFLNQTSPDWLQAAGGSSDSVVSDEELDDWLNQFGTPSTAKDEAPSSPDWLDSLSEPMDLAESAAPITPAEPFAASIEAQDEELEWMSESERPQDEAQPEESGIPDWLSDLNPEAQPETSGVSGTSDDDFPWDSLSEYSESAADEASAQEGDLPDWLRESSPLDLGGANAPADASEENESSEFDWLTEEAIEGASSTLDDAASAGDAAWMTDFNTEAEPLPLMDAEASAAEAEPSAAEADWLTELTSQSDLDDTELPDAASGEAAYGQEAVEAAADADLSWLSELEEVPADAAAVVAATSDEAAEQVAEGIPDWLSEMEPEPDATAVAVPEAAVSNIDDETFDWLNTLPEPELPADAVDAGEMIEDAPAPVVGEPIPAEPLAAGSPSTEPAEEDGVPDWLADMESPSEVSAISEPMDEDAVEWQQAMDDQSALAESTPQQEWVAETFGVGGDVDDNAVERMEAGEPEDDSWLVLGAATAGATMSIEGAGFDEDDEDPFAASEDSSFRFEGEKSFEEEFEETFGTSEESAQDEGTPFEVDMPEEEGFEVAAATIQDEALAPVPAENAPDWLNAMVPGLDVDYEEQENVLPEEEFEEVAETPIPVHEADEATEFAWLERIVSEELASDSAPMPALPRFVFSRRPAWTRQAAQPDDDFPDWVLDEDE